MVDFLDGDSTPVAIANATSLAVSGWAGEFSQSQCFWRFVLAAIDAEDVSVHGFVTDGAELALACVHAGGRRRVVALEPPAPPDEIDDDARYAAWIAGVLAGVVDEPDDDRAAVVAGGYLLPVGEAWDAHFVIKPAEGCIYPSADPERSYLADGAAALGARGPGEPVEFWFDAPGFDDPDGKHPDEASGPWLFQAWPDGSEARVVLGFFGGSMGPDEVYGWAAWTDDAVWYAANDGSTGACAIVKAAKPGELRGRGPDDPAWWLALARLLLVIQPLAVEDPLYERR
jgi:hypothetical protein